MWASPAWRWRWSRHGGGVANRTSASSAVSGLRNSGWRRGQRGSVREAREQDRNERCPHRRDQRGSDRRRGASPSGQSSRQTFHVSPRNIGWVAAPPRADQGECRPRLRVDARRTAPLDVSITPWFSTRSNVSSVGCRSPANSDRDRSMPSVQQRRCHPIGTSYATGCRRSFPRGSSLPRGSPPGTRARRADGGDRRRFSLSVRCRAEVIHHENRWARQARRRPAGIARSSVSLPDL